ncbi:hypothetical protein FRC14_007268 [Serendipita sp. 396]|nr:hypothetical protein FRC14_007268 [Serendipita sp. 396]KAG8767623.1 hypothetical protein FRC15_005552 [Serendipita sp. 397]
MVDGTTSRSQSHAEGNNQKDTNSAIISSEINLPCGIVVQNRLVKVAMYEHLSPLGGGVPNTYHLSLYSTWARGKWGIIITGNVQVSPSHLGLGGDLVIPPLGKPYDIEPWSRLSAAMHACPIGEQPSLALMQLCHVGRQSPRFIGGRRLWDSPLAPSSKRVGENVPESILSRLLYWILFQTPNEMEERDIDHAVDQYRHGAALAMNAGFDGVQLHGSHGYLITQFMSPKTNTRSDQYSKPLLFLYRIASQIRKQVPKKFVLSVKLNAADYVEGGMTEEEGLRHVEEITRWDLFDIIEISGGDYENPEFISSGSKRQAFFLHFAQKASLMVEKVASELTISPPAILLTGSLRGQASIASVLHKNEASLIGIARPAVVLPSYPRFLMDESLPPEAIPTPFEPTLPKLRVSKLAGASVNTMWYCYEMKRLAGFTLQGSTLEYRPSKAPALWRVLICYLSALWLLIVGSLGL